MPDDPVKKLLVKLGISTTEWKNAVREIKSQLDSVNKQAKSDAEEMKRIQMQQISLTKQQITDQQRLTAESKAMAAFDQAKASWERKNQEALKTRLQQKILETAELKKQEQQQQMAVKLEQQRLRLQQQQLKLIQQQANEEKKRQEGGGLFSKLGGALGGGLLGAVTGGAALGTIIGEGSIALLEKGVDLFKELGHSIMEATGPASQLREQFEKLVKRTGEGPEEYLLGLRRAVHGLADDQQLFRISNNFMQQGLKVSNEQITKLIGTTVDLARATGHTAPQALQRLERASSRGRMATLAYVVGLKAQQLQLQGISKAIDPTVRGTMEIIHATDVMAAALKAVGPPATTLPELFTRMRNTQKNFADDIAFTVTRTSGYRAAITAISNALDKMEAVVTPAAKALTEFLAPLISATVVAGISVLRTSLEVVTSLAKDTANMFSFLFDVIGKKHGEKDYLNDTVTRLTSIKGLLLTVFNIWQFIELTIRKTLIDVEQIGANLRIMATTNPMKWADAFHDSEMKFGAKYGAVDMDAAREKQQFLASLSGKAVPVGAAGPTNLPTQDQANIARQEAKLRLNITMERIKAENALEEQRISYAREANKQMYDTGLEDLQTYLAKERDYLAQEHALKLKQIEDERKAKLRELAEESKGMTYKDQEGKTVNVPSMAPGIISLKREQINQQAMLQTDLENLRSEKAGFGPDKEQLADATAAYRTYIDTINKLAKAGVQERVSVLEEEFKLGKIGADDYLAQKKQYIDQEYQLVKAGLDARFEAAKKNSTETARINADLIQAEIDREKQLTKLSLDEDKIRIEALQTHYNQAKKFLEIEIATAGRDKLGTSKETEQLATSALLDITREHLQQLQAEQDQLNPQVRGFSDEWVKVSESIAQARQEEQKLNQQLAISRDTAAPLAGIFGSIAGVAGSLGRSGGHTAEFFGKLQSSFESLSKFNIANQTSIGAGQGSLIGSLGHSFTGLFHRGGGGGATAARQTAQQIFEQGLQKGGTSATTFGTEVQTASTRMKELEGRLSELANAAKGTTDALVEKAQNQGISATVTGTATDVPTIASTLGDTISESLSPKKAAAGGGGSLLGGLGGIFSGLADHVNKANKAFSPLATKLGDFGGKLAGAAQGAQGFIQGITSGKSGGQGALSGGLSGLQFGAQVGGPIGAIVGGVAGGVLGGIFGAKEKQLQQDLHKIQIQMQGILDSLNAGTITLSQAIADLRRERQAALQMLSQDPKGGKGGGKGGKKGFGPTQAQAAIAEIDSQIAKLVDEQKQILDNLHQSLMQIAQPTQFQEYISSLDQIIQKYQQFASAAQGNAQEVALANQFLTDSLQNYVSTLEQNLNQAQQQAIQDALQLINLEYQRQQLINSEAQQEYDILTQGVMVRQRTTAMTKGQQIGQLRYQRDMQLQQMNEQIALAQHKVDAESKIFNLAKDRIGLETELLVAQEEQADYQVKQIQALAQVVAALQSGLSGGQLMQQLSQLFAAGALPTGTGLLNVLIQQLGLGGNLPPGVLTGPYGATNWLAQVPQPYQSAANYVANMDPNFVALLQAGKTSQAAADAQQYASQGTVEGFDMAGLINWLKGNPKIGAVNPPASGAPGYQEGGVLPKSGLIYGHEGERVLSKETTNVFDKFIDFVKNPIRFSPKYPTPLKPTGPIYPVDQSPLLSSLKIKTEQHLTNMTQKRSSMEMTVISQRQSLIDSEMQYLQALQETMGNISSMSDGGTPAYSLEGMFQHVYERRGRYGSGTFRRQVL